ncbi:MAG TPA: septal ring lytic transglycosylase RlpA family protein [Candidatus Methylomirabilis sp.]|nr:septal ring lytic transglycosylase RlpA family protein [Candidatus Methylomirabilis sp.]
MVAPSLRLAAALILAAALAGCATSGGSVQPPRSVDLPAPPPPAPPEPSAQTGYASWYGKAHQGRPTTSGEPYDMNKLTAAHPSLPMGTRLLVTNLKNGRSVTVRVNDRGPAVDGRIVDLSFAAARELSAVGDGVVPVRIQVVSSP